MKRAALAIVISLIFCTYQSGCTSNRIDTDNTLSDSSMQDENIVFYENGNSLLYDELQFTGQDAQIVAQLVGKPIGITNTGCTVYSIGELPQNEWIGILFNGKLEVFKERSLPFLSISVFAPDRLVVKEGYSLMGKGIEIREKRLIETVCSYITDDRLVSPPESIEHFQILDFYSERIPGISYSFMYLHGADGHCFLMDFSLEKTWMIGHELMEYLA